MLPDWAATPTHLARNWQIQRWELQDHWVPWDSIPDLDRDSPAFAYIRLRRDTGAVQPWRYCLKWVLGTGH